VFFLLSLLALHAGAQRYNIYVTGTPETKCILPNEGPYCLDEFPKVMVACQGSEVDYTAYFTIESNDFPVGWNWEIEGGTLSNSTGNPVHVTWGNVESGELVVTVTTDSGRVLTHHQVVQLIAPPNVSAITVPAGTYNSHTIYVCSGGSVEFTDNSSADSSDIAGYYWGGSCGEATTQSYTIDNIFSDCTVTHRVYNNCGCYDEEEFHIEVQDGDPLRIDCYGTACEGSKVTYHAISPSCTDYRWVIEGGTLLGGQHTSDITVLWDNPQNGYGVVSIDGTACGGNACPNKTSVKIPIIQNGLSISGPTAVCQGEGAIFSVPHFGSTSYTWTITPPLAPAVINGANQIEYIFTTPGTYQLKVEYRCDFLECGPFYSVPLTIEVKPRLSIIGDDEMCITNTGVLKTEPPDNVTWNVYEAGNSQPIYTSSSPEPSPNPTFSQAGRYKITAQSSNYCNEAEFFLTVKDAPPAPTLSDMDPDNPTIACPTSSILLKSRISNPYLSTVWIPTCPVLSPDTVSGDDVTISYGSTVCNVDVYTYDRKLRCLSQGGYTHIVKQFVLEPVTIASPITVCPGTRIKWTDADVPPQDGVIYEWQFGQDTQFCASIEGDRYNNKATVKVNDFSSLTNPITFTVHLVRTYCSGTTDTTKIPITISDLSGAATLQITPPDSICQNHLVTFSGSGNNTLDWYFPGASGPLHGSSVDYAFAEAGPTTVTLSCNLYDFCTNSNYIPQVSITTMVYPVPPVVSIGYDGTNVFTVPQLSTTDYTFQWSHTNVNDWKVSAAPNTSNYSCTVKGINSPRCQITVDNEVVPCGHMDVVQVGTINYCTMEVTFRVPNPIGPILWTIEGFSHGTPSYSGTYNEEITVPVYSVGNHTITANTTLDSPCKTGSAAFTVDFIPNFTFEKRCDSIVVHNNSMYLDGTKTVTLSIANYGLLTFPVNKDTVVVHTGPGGPFTLTFTLTDYDGHTLICPLGSVTIANSAGQTVSITSANTSNPDQTCDNTAIVLTATVPSPHSIMTSHWDFSDHGSCIDTIGNNVLHTFWCDPRYSPYNIFVSILDENGCSSSGSFLINSNANDLKKESLQIISTPTTICPGSSIDIEYHANQQPLSSLSDTFYWSTSPSPDYQGVHHVYYTGDYSVVVKNENYCEARASVNVGFKNKPKALIIPKKYHYCVGEEIVIYGEPSESDNYDYHWTITEPNMGTSFTPPTTSSVLTFPTPPSTCDLTVELTVKDRTTNCVSNLATTTISVHEPPQAPAIAISNTNYCIGNPPVTLESVNPGMDIHWSNGDFGDMAEYYYPGYATAHYYDPISGCRSELAEIRIPAAPDFDALLTGCYEFCSEQLPGTLPVYGLLPVNQPFGWTWFYYGNIYASCNPSSTPVFLPLPGFGKYNMNVYYYNDCYADSKQLVLREDSVCTCDGITVSYESKCIPNGCTLIYNIEVTVCNNTSESVCFTSLTPLFDNLSGNGIYMSSTDFSTLSIGSYNCGVFHMQLVVSDLDTAMATFRLRDRNCTDCELIFGIDLMEPLTNLNVGCTHRVYSAYTNQNGDLSDISAFYYDFRLDLSGVTSPSVVAVWSEPSAIIDYTLNGTNLEGIGVYYGDPDQQDLICIHALLCYNGQLCLWTYCIYVNNIPRRVIPYIGDRSAGNEKSGRGKEITEDVSEPKLMPNPTTGDVSIVGTSDEVEEVLVMDMNGRKMATFDKTDHFNVAALPSGIYIVRVRTSSVTNSDTSEVPQQQVTYLKLVKK
jgi:hypothetical protein